MGSGGIWVWEKALRVWISRKAFLRSDLSREKERPREK